MTWGRMVQFVILELAKDVHFNLDVQYTYQKSNIQCPLHNTGYPKKPWTYKYRHWFAYSRIQHSCLTCLPTLIWLRSAFSVPWLDRQECLLMENLNQN